MQAKRKGLPGRRMRPKSVVDCVEGISAGRHFKYIVRMMIDHLFDLLKMTFPIYCLVFQELLKVLNERMQSFQQIEYKIIINVNIFRNRFSITRTASNFATTVEALGEGTT